MAKKEYTIEELTNMGATPAKENRGVSLLSGGAGVGALKGVASTLYTAPESIRRAAAAITTRLSEQKGGISPEESAEAEKRAIEAYQKATPEQRKQFNLPTPEEISRAGIEAREARLLPTETLESALTTEKPRAIRPVGPAENFGFTAEQIAEYFVPSSTTAKIASKISAIKPIAKVSSSGRIGKVVSDAASKGLAEALAGGTVTAAQSGEIKSAIDAAIISSAFPAIGRAISATGGLTAPMRKALGARVINSLISRAKDFSYGANPGRTVSELGIVANNLDDLTEKISSKRMEIGESLGSIYKNSNKRISVEGITAPIDEAISKAKSAPRTNADLITRLENSKSDLLEFVNSRQSNGSLSAEDALRLKGLIGDITKWTGSASDDKLANLSLKRTYGNIKSILDKEVPESTKLSGQYADLITAENSSRYRDALAQSRGLVSLPIKVGATAGIITGAFTGGLSVPAILTTIGVGAAEKALESTAAKTRVASWLAGASKAEKASVFGNNPALRALMVKTFFGQ